MIIGQIEDSSLLTVNNFLLFFHNFFCYPTINSISPSTNDLRSSSLISLLHFLLFSLFFLLLCYGRKISILLSIFFYIYHIKSNSVLFSGAIQLNKNLSLTKTKIGKKNDDKLVYKSTNMLKPHLRFR